MPTEPDRALTRRRLFGAAGAAGAAAAVSVAGQGHAAAAPLHSPQPLARAKSGGSRPETIPPMNAGLEYYTYPAAAFVPKGLTIGRVIDGLGARLVAAADDMIAPVTLPVGSVVKEMTVWATNNGELGTYLDLGHYSNDVDDAVYLYPLNVAIPNGQAIGDPITSTVATTIEAGRNYFLNFFANSTDVWIKAVRLGVMPAALSYRTVTPGRVYDSRPAQLGAGPLATGLNRTISVANRINPVGGSQVQADFVPVGARAVSLNITAVNTVGNGFFAVNPGGTTALGASSLNWTAGQTIANGIVCALDASRQLTIVAGGSNTSANFLIDITGYYL